jgi:hypothetical protein
VRHKWPGPGPVTRRSECCGWESRAAHHPRVPRPLAADSAPLMSKINHHDWIPVSKNYQIRLFHAAIRHPPHPPLRA